MKAILRTNNYDEDYKIVEVLKNPISRNNSMALVLIDGKEYITGGILVEHNNITESILNLLSPKKQWDWLKSISCPDVYVHIKEVEI